MEERMQVGTSPLVWHWSLCLLSTSPPTELRTKKAMRQFRPQDQDRGDPYQPFEIKGCKDEWHADGRDRSQRRPSPDGKYRQRSKTAAQAIADCEASKTLARAHEAVELAVAKRNSEQHVSPEIAQDSEAMLKAMKEAEHGWQRAIDKIAERAGLTKRLDTRR